MKNLRRVNNDGKATDGLAKLTLNKRAVTLIGKEETTDEQPSTLRGMRNSSTKTKKLAEAGRLAELAGKATSSAKGIAEGDDDADPTIELANQGTSHTVSRAKETIIRRSSAKGNSVRRSGVISNKRKATAAAKAVKNTKNASAAASRSATLSARAAATASAWVKTIATSAIALATSVPIMGVVSAVVALVVLVVTIISFILPGMAAACQPSIAGGKIDASSVSSTPIAGYGHEQLVNAANIVSAGKDLGLTTRDQTVAVMTAMGESTLNNITFGDWETGGVTNPDGSRTTSIGLFQQQDSWGSVEDRLDPYKSAALFYQALQAKVSTEDRASLAPTLIAHRVQANSNPYHYEPFWAAAQAVVAGVSGAGGSTAAGFSGSCNNDPLVPGQIGKDGWASPANPPVTEKFGPREVIQTPGGATNPFHGGADFGGGCDSPIWAARNGTVKDVFVDGFGNWTMDIDHGQGLMTRYMHMWADGTLVKRGDKVKAGQQVARIGASGQSIGCHLHFEMHLNGEKIDPLAVLKNAGITY